MNQTGEDIIRDAKSLQNRIKRAKGEEPDEDTVTIVDSAFGATTQWTGSSAMMPTIDQLSGYVRKMIEGEEEEDLSACCDAKVDEGGFCTQCKEHDR